MTFRLRLFNTYVTPIFMYNSEIWTMTPTLNNTIDSFHRKLLRRVLNNHYPHIIPTTELYTRTKQVKWSEIIRQHRLRFTGHLLRLDKTTPARRALEEALRPTRRPPGRPKTTWLEVTKADLRGIGIEGGVGADQALRAAQYRDGWRKLITGRTNPPGPPRA